MEKQPGPAQQATCDVKAEFKRRLNRQWFMAVLLLLLALVVIVVSTVGGFVAEWVSFWARLQVPMSMIFCTVMGVLGLAIWICSRWNWCCPACHQRLGSMKVKYCGACGVQLHD